jgi:hypothetical protein
MTLSDSFLIRTLEPREAVRANKTNKQSVRLPEIYASERYTVKTPSPRRPTKTEERKSRISELYLSI